MHRALSAVDLRGSGVLMPDGHVLTAVGGQLPQALGPAVERAMRLMVLRMGPAAMQRSGKSRGSALGAAQVCSMSDEA